MMTNNDLGHLPLVCICIPIHNAESTIMETYNSILNQDYSNLAIHIVDNASTDHSLDIINNKPDHRIFIHKHKTNIGGEENFDYCITLARGKYTAIFHADDVYESTMVSKQVAYLEANSEVGAVFTKAQTIDENGRLMGIIGGIPDGRKGVHSLGYCELLRLMLRYHNFLVCPSVLVRTEIYRDIIKVWGNPKFKSASDVNLWLRLAQCKPIAVLDEPLMKYRISTNQFSHTNRTRTYRPDFFLVMDHYLNIPETRDLLTENDFRYYGWLQRHDRVARAMNAFISGQFLESKNLLNGFYCLDLFYSALFSRRGFVTLLGGSLLRLFLLFSCSRLAVRIVNFVKGISWK